MEVKISIIIPNYNHFNFLEQRIESVLNQTYQDFEVILLDDASTDNSLDIIKKYQNHDKIVHCIINDVNSGSTFAQWFKGIQVASGDYIWIAESDDYASPLFLEKAMSCFKEDFNPDVVFVGTTNVDSNNNDVGNTTRIERHYKALLEKDFNVVGEVFLNYFIPDYCVIRNASSAVFKKSVLNKEAKKTVTYEVIGDFYFWVNLCLENCRFTYIAEKLNYMRKHENTVRNNSKKVAFKRSEFQRVHNTILLRKWFNYAIIKKIIKYKLKQKIKKS